MNKRYTLLALSLLAALGLVAVWQLVREDVAGTPPGVAGGLPESWSNGPGPTRDAWAAMPERFEVGSAPRVPVLEAVLESGGHSADAEEPLAWTMAFELDHSLVYQRGLARQGTGAATQYFGAIYSHGMPLVELGRMDLPFEGAATVSFFPQSWNEGGLDGATLVLSSTPDGIQPQGRVYFGEGLHSRVERDFLPLDLSSSAPRRIDLGRLLVQPVPRLGLLRVGPREDFAELDVYVSPHGKQQELLGQFGRPSPGGLRQMTSNGGDLEAFSFAAGARWSVLLKARGGDLLFSGEAQRGMDIEVVYHRPQGMKVTVDLEQTPDARRVLIVTRDVDHSVVLGEAAYEARLRAAVRTAAIPLPRFRGPGKSLTTGLLDLHDGQFRVEVWGRKGETEWQRFLARDTSVAGDIVEVFL